jgi:hypothetical protein
VVLIDRPYIPLINKKRFSAAEQLCMLPEVTWLNQGTYAAKNTIAGGSLPGFFSIPVVTSAAQPIEDNFYAVFFQFSWIFDGGGGGHPHMHRHLDIHPRRGQGVATLACGWGGRRPNYGEWTETLALCILCAMNWAMAKNPPTTYSKQFAKHCSLFVLQIFLYI